VYYENTDFVGMYVSLRNEELFIPQTKFLCGHKYKTPRITVLLESERKRSLKAMNLTDAIPFCSNTFV